MSANPVPVEKFFENSDLTPETARTIVQEGLKGADYGEFYQEITESEYLAKNDGAYTSVAIGNGSSGFGFRVGKDASVGYSFSDIFNEASLKKSVEQAREVLDGSIGAPTHHSSGRVTGQLYTAKNPLEGISLEDKIKKLDDLENYAKSLDSDIVNISLTYSSSVKAVHIITADGQSLTDRRPMSSLHVQVTVKDKNGNQESGMALLGGRVTCKDVFNEAAGKAAVNKALKMAKTLLIADEAPAGVMDVVLSPGWSAVLLHEAVGHGLEGDFNRKDISAYSGKIGQKIAADEVTVIDQGDMPGERGSIHFDDEGTRTQKNILIENGVLKGYMQDRQNAHLMNVPVTGNGRRENYREIPIPRMTNTYFANGTHDPEDIIKSVKDGLYISDMGGGQVDITSGKFNMNATLAYRIRNGKICEPVKGASLTGDGLTVIQSIRMVGNDLTIEKSAGTCGKDGQSVTVGCGQPTILVSNMTVGGTKNK